MALLNQNIGHIVGAVVAQLLIQRSTTNSRGVAFHLDYVAIDGFGFLRQFQQLGSVLGINFNLAVAEVNCHLVEDVVII